MEVKKVENVRKLLKEKKLNVKVLVKERRVVNVKRHINVRIKRTKKININNLYYFIQITNII